MCSPVSPELSGVHSNGIVAQGAQRWVWDDVEFGLVDEKAVTRIFESMPMAIMTYLPNHDFPSNVTRQAGKVVR